MKHCVKCKTQKTLYLYANKDFNSRYIKVSECPRCGKTVIELYEERKLDNQIFYERKTGIEADKFLNRIKTEIEYVCYNDKQNNKPVGWVYGYNKQYKDGSVKQFAVDFKGNKEIVKQISNTTY